MKRVLAVAAAVAVLALGAGCRHEGRGHGGPAAAQPVASPSFAVPVVATSPIPTPSAAFTNAVDLARALERKGLFCGVTEPVEHATLATSLADCGEHVVLGIYASHTDALGAFTLLVGLHQRNHDGYHTHMAIGSNWTVSSSTPDFAQQAAAALGGKYQTT